MTGRRLFGYIVGISTIISTLLGFFDHYYPKNESITEVKNEQKVEKNNGTSIQQNSSGSGDNISGDKVMGDKITNNAANLLTSTHGQIDNKVSLPSPTESKVANTIIDQLQNNTACNSDEKLDRLPFSIHTLAKDYFNSFRTPSGKEKNDFREDKYIGLIVIDKGFVQSISTSTDNNSLPSISIRENRMAQSMDFFLSIYCYFNARWAKTLEALKVGQEINYCGEIYNFVINARLNNCVLK